MPNFHWKNTSFRCTPHCSELFSISNYKFFQNFFHWPSKIKWFLLTQLKTQSQHALVANFNINLKHSPWKSPSSSPELDGVSGDGLRDVLLGEPLMGGGEVALSGVVGDFLDWAETCKTRTAVHIRSMDQNVFYKCPKNTSMKKGVATMNSIRTHFLSN